MKLIQTLKSKIHNIAVEACDPNYVGSIEIPGPLMDEVGLFDNELVHVWAMNHRARIQTYVIRGDNGSGVRINGGAAHQFTVGDHVVIAAFQWIDSRDADFYPPKLHIIDPR